MQLIALNGFASDPDSAAGVEKLCICAMRPEWLTQKPQYTQEEQDALSGTGTARARSFFMVKGWNRAICGLGVLYACWQSSDILQARRVVNPHWASERVARLFRLRFGSVLFALNVFVAHS